MRNVIVQEKVVENQVRPTVLAEPIPGGIFFTVAALAITTTAGSFLDIDASLGALMAGDPGATVDGGVRIVVDGDASGIGSGVTIDATGNDKLVNFSIQGRVAITPGPHTVELQWYVASGTSESLIGFINPNLDGCSMCVREVAL